MQSSSRVARTITDELWKYGACQEARFWVDKTVLEKGVKSRKELWEACDNRMWLLWYLSYTAAPTKRKNLELGLSVACLIYEKIARRYSKPTIDRVHRYLMAMSEQLKKKNSILPVWETREDSVLNTVCRYLPITYGRLLNYVDYIMDIAEAEGIANEHICSLIRAVYPTPPKLQQ